MWKSLVVLAVAANTFFITPGGGSSYSMASASATSGSGYPTGGGGYHKPPPKCPKNEVFDKCPAPCPPRECGVNKALILCAPAPKPGSRDCKPGCRCADNFLRNKAGACIPEAQCPIDCPKNETLDPCLSLCPPRYCGVNIAAISCAATVDCEPGCRCQDGFLRNAEGFCVDEQDCPKCTNQNEVYDVCPAPCPPRRCDVDPRVIRCAAPPNPGDPECEPGCRCADEYVRNSKGICVTRDQCPPDCGDNEVLSPCSNGGCGPWTCSDVGFPTGCVKMDQKYCKEGCICKEGYVKENGVCIPSTDCPSCGGDSNAVAGCGINCGRLCSNYNKGPVSCVAVCLRNACDCKKKYVFDENINKCVLPEECTPVCGKNEVFSECVNGGCQAKNCSQLGQKVTCVKPPKCKPGCLCQEGFLRAANGTCVPKNQCPPKCTGANEVYDPCPPTCPPQSCDSIGKKYFCPLMPAKKTCNGACRCKPNYLRNKIGQCIAAKDCMKCTGPNEYFSCGGACDNVCATMSEQNQTKCPIVNIQCNSMCYCEKGYARDEKKICIPIEECPEKCGVNERLEPCPDRLCSPQSCKELGFPISCPDQPEDENTPCPGPPACVCEFNYVRDKNGKCIPKQQCPSCGGDPNAQSGCGLNCGRLCSNYDKGPVPCPRICFPNSCDCKKDFVYDENIKKCVRPKQCTPVCGDNEVYSECINGGCQRKNCSQLGKPVPCVKIDPKYCIKGCLCVQGYLREVNGICVPEDQCNKCNKPHEHYDPCAPSCPPQTCESIGRQYKCPITAQVCRGACRCDKGHFRNKIGECIAKNDCLKCKGPHEYFSCGGACDNVCATLYKQNQTNCPIKNIKCNPMCYCEKGYARDKNNTCIPIDKCPVPICGKNERLEQCPPSLCTPQKCTDLGFPIPCFDIAENQCPEPPACICINNYVRDASGKCIPSDKCPSCGGDPNAVPGCGINCGKRCSDYNNKGPRICPDICLLNGCDCKDGFLYDDNLRKCVRPKDCTPICQQNEVYDACANGGCGKRNCSQLGQPDICIDVIKCIGNCVCQEGFLRAKNGTCIPQNQCPIPHCGKNERFEQCPDASCEPQFCSQLGFPISCPALSGDEDCPGSPACICDSNFVRDKNGICIPKNKCPSCGGDPNAVSGCGINCGRLCSNYNKGPVPCPKICKFNACDCKKDFVFDVNTNKCVRPKDCTPVCGDNEVYSECINGGCQRKNCSQLGKPVPCVKIDPKYCIKGCLCIEGYLREVNGVCVPEDQCNKCNKPHEHYDPCAPSCPPQTCESIGRQYKCPITAQVCRGACRCDKGHFRNKIGECIAKNDCLKCKGPHEYFSCGGACDNVCATLYKQNQTNCPIKNIKCNPKCYCEKGYARDKNNICIPIDKCPVPKCGVNERLEQCPDSLCSPQKCSQLGFPIPCPAWSGNSSTPCPGPPGCVCDNDYVRDKTGKCVPRYECHSCGGDPNAQPGCGVNCGKRCSDYNKKGPIFCPLICLENGCDCKDGYLYDGNLKKCVRPKDCTPTCGANEVYDICANGGCQKRNCSQVGQPTLCIDPIKCIGGCVCQEGYLRAKNGSCVPENQCPVPKCGENERLEDCPDSLCTPQTCSQLGFPISCPAYSGDPYSTCPGRPGCVCIDNYVKDDCGKCIPKGQCPSCGGDPNAVSGCGINCGRLCSNYKKKDVVCILGCNLNGCDCRKGFVYDSNIKKCVRPKDCTPTCGKNEVYDICANGGCQKRNCSQVGEPTLCIDPLKCIGGCVCRKGYLRTKNGTCVPEDQCPLQCTKPHEVYDPCPPSCPPQTCDKIGKVYPCPMVPPNSDKYCKGACRCEKGYYRNGIGECISESDCLKCTGPNEHFSCGGACDNVCATLQKQNQTNCPIINKKCNPKCYCDKGYARDDNNICIPIKQCGVSCNGDPNAIPGCGTYCGNRCSDYNKGIVACPAICFLDSCDCKQSYVYDDNLKKCVQPKDCTPICGKDEVYNTCINGGCQKKKCSDLGRPDICVRPKKCIDGCLCKDGFLRADNGTCVPIRQCPTPVCSKNEVFDTCANGGCKRLKCSELVDPIICRDPFGDCIGDCVCVKGFLRNDDGVCVPEAECQPTCRGPHEIFKSCPSTCPPQTCESLDKVYICPIETGQDVPCEPCCVCEDGFYRNNIGVCTSEKDCLKCMGPHEFFSCGGACDNVCATLSEQNQTNCPIINIQCNSMCYCEEGYARDENNICIPIEDCPLKCTEPHEVYNPCPSTCPPQTCESLDRAYICPIEWGQEPPCRKACVCEQGFYRNKIGECISEEDCLQCMGPNEYFTCGGACDNVCLTLNEQSQASCPIINVACNRMCYCDDGYARNESNICIPIEDCPPSRCGPNERYEENPSKVCEPLYCSELDIPMDCPPVDDPDCEDTPACICKRGFVRNKQGICIPKSECPPTNTTTPPVNSTEARARFDTGSIVLAGEFLNQIIASKPDENFVASGTSVLIPLAQLALYAEELVLEQLLKVLGLKNKDEIKTVFPALAKEFKNQENVEFDLANKCYMNQDFLLSPNFKSASYKYFDAEVENLDFSQSVSAAETINNWVSNQTRGKIQNLVKPEMFSAATRLVLANAIYFQGNWIHPFNPNDTKIDDFYKSNGETVPLKIMNQQNTFNYYENDKFQAVQMFYEGNTFSFLVVLPRDIKYGVRDTSKTLENPDAFRNMIDNLIPQKVKLSLPPILIQSELDIGEMLKKDNLTAMFVPNNNGFKGILENDEPLFVSDAVQKAYLSVDETGTVAAAATAITVGTTSAIYPSPKIYSFIANHPYIFYLLFGEDIPLFCGSFVGAQ